MCMKKNASWLISSAGKTKDKLLFTPVCIVHLHGVQHLFRLTVDESVCHSQATDLISKLWQRKQDASRTNVDV